MLIERLHLAHGQRIQLAELALDLHTSTRTVARDVERLRLSGVPLRTHQGRGGGVSLESVNSVITVLLDLPEAAALMSSLAVLGPSANDSAASAMRKLTRAVNPPASTRQDLPTSSSRFDRPGHPPMRNR